MKRRALIFTLVAIGCVIGLLAGLVLLQEDESVVIPPLPVPNGYDDLAAAALGLEGVIEYYSSVNGGEGASTEELRAYLAKHSEALARMRIGLARSSQVPIEDFMTNNPVVIARVKGFRDLGRLIELEGVVEEREDRPLGAAERYLELMRFGFAISNEGLLIDAIVASAIQENATRRVHALKTVLNAEELRLVIGQLEPLKEQFAPVDGIVARDGQVMSRYVSPLARVAQLFMSSSFKDMTKIVSANLHRVEALVALLIAELAVQRYELVKGRKPATLAELVPEYLARVPADPFGQSELKYRDDGEGSVPYSVGVDGKDDNGDPAADLLFRPAEESSKTPPGLPGND